ncbi:MAG: hypothetical protein B7Z66_03305 [Chromatiales bacterium 21-64-14]|nr:MAG: hypothetical protein B7Z66_03305 [Chromatiales bacterium 21-64-14]HQU15834.1 DsbA family protein [Gammaproteobacteria bacterium]
MDKPTLLVTVFVDYICPFCYVGVTRLDALRETYDLRVNWCLLEVHPENSPATIPAEALPYEPELLKRKMTRLARMAAEEGLRFADLTVSTNSHRALLLSEAAKEDDRAVFYRLHRRLYEAYFAEGRNIGAEEELRELAASCEVGADTVRRAWTDPRYEERLQRNRRLALQLGIVNTPTYLFGDRIVAGAVSKERLVGAAQEVAAAAC